MRVVHGVQQLRDALGPRHPQRRLALVPTMGNLHAGHLALVARAHHVAEQVAVSIFVNPLQFAPTEDLSRYPRTLEEDLAQLSVAGADVVFVPAVEDVYPGGYPPVTRVQVTGYLAEDLEGASRPGHFDGVATVVSILFNLVQPDVAVFGAKDWQQLQVIRRMVVDLGIRVAVLGEPIVRAADGLALSSRNSYLTSAERAVAPQLHAALKAVAAELGAGRRDYRALCGTHFKRLAQASFAPHYLEIRRPDLSPPCAGDRDLVILVAARLGKARLIDNLRVAGL